MTDDIQHLIDEATFDFTVGDHEAALEKLGRATREAPERAEGWHALAEILFSERRFDEALQAAETALRLKPEDAFIHTSLSRIWMEKGDKARAESFGAQARILGWKDQIKGDS